MRKMREVIITVTKECDNKHKNGILEQEMATHSSILA